ARSRKIRARRKLKSVRRHDLKTFATVEQDRYWTIVYEFHLHRFTEAASLHPLEQLPATLHEIIVQRLGNFRRCGVAPRRSQAASHITVQSELRYNQQPAFTVFE